MSYQVQEFASKYITTPFWKEMEHFSQKHSYLARLSVIVILPGIPIRDLVVSIAELIERIVVLARHIFHPQVNQDQSSPAKLVGKVVWYALQIPLAPLLGLKDSIFSTVEMLRSPLSQSFYEINFERFRTFTQFESYLTFYSPKIIGQFDRAPVNRLTENQFLLEAWMRFINDAPECKFGEGKYDLEAMQKDFNMRMQNANAMNWTRITSDKVQNKIKEDLDTCKKLTGAWNKYQIETLEAQTFGDSQYVPSYEALNTILIDIINK